MQRVMDRALKERIIGAIVLVVFAVLVVPVFLDGPSDQAGDVAESITLPGQNGTATKTQRIVLSRNRTEPVPSQPLPEASAPEAVQEDEPAPVEEKPEAPAQQEPAPQQKEPSASQKTDSAGDVAAPEKIEAEQSATGMWAVQLGSFGDKNNADRLAANLRGEGYAAFLSQLKKGQGALHRVRVGPQKDRAEAEAVAARLASQGHKGQVVPHP